MSVTTQLQVRGLVRDSSGQLASQAGALRRAENVVVRAPGVAESRPNFDLYREKISSSLRIKGLREFEGSPVAVEQNASTGAWGLRALSSDTKYTAPICGGISYEPEPVSYDAAETCFAEARDALYMTSKRGILRLVDPTNTSTGLDWAGVEMLCVTDWLTRNLSLTAQDHSWAYCAVYVRNDPTGMGSVRRSPPSERWVVTRDDLHDVRPPSASRFYFSLRLRVGDQVEFYRTREADLDAPSSEMFLAFVHTLTAADLSLQYFVPTYDERSDDELGVALYTSPSQQGALAAKYPPPRAQAMAYFGSCMWYARATQPCRVALTLRSIGLGGPVRGAVSAGASGGGLLATFTLGSPTVTINTAGLKEGADFSDNLVFGSTVAGTSVPALTTISTVDTPTQITMSANALANGSRIAGMMSRYAPSGIAVSVGDGTGTHTLGSPIVTAITSTANMRAGMGWTDSANGPAAIGTVTAADTRILSVDSATQITLTKNALANGTSCYAYDCVEVATWPFYAWPGDVLLAANTPVWNWPLRCVPYWSAAFGLQSMASFMTNLAIAVNWRSVQNTTFRVKAIAVGDTNLDDKEVTNWCRSIIFEECKGIGDGFVTFGTSGTYPGDFATTPFTVVPSRSTAFDPVQTTHTSSNDDRPNRIYWSDPDEPEAVRLTSFVDVGQAQFAVLALVPMSDCLLVFTQRGLYRVTGSAPNAWSVECLDSALRLMRPECVATVGEVVYAWCDRGFVAATSSGVRSISAGALDSELLALTQFLEGASCHGAFVVAWPQRQLVLFGVPGVITATKTAKVYAYSLVTEAWSEWPVEWGVAAESKSDNLYHSRPADSVVSYEARSARQGVTGYDRLHSLASIVSLVTTTLTVTVAVAGQWQPVVGDMASAVIGGTRYFRRITAVSTVGSDYVLTIESVFPSGSATVWRAYETAACRVILEWHPTSPARIPNGAICRELQVQLDLRDAPTETEKLVSSPEYIVGGTSERDTSPYTITSNRARTLQIQPIRVGCSRQIARSAMIAPYFSMADIFCLRVNGISLVYEGTGERTRR